ncbi:RNA polymerase subunit sigma-70 [Mucilaginibacter hurinus]|uniref:RNA polymerase subunit sigma-70 n=2 Tax=Mucilaginibacter hurinus TaxID=2201324 RepID=A0A367GP11_9SPHI|nr:RNA polymerase subunit sigma-70 [Mucilaginibacter hurinus]
MFLERTFTIDELIKRCKTGDRKACELLYKGFASKMLGVCMRYATDKMEAEDMLQNGFIKVFSRLNDYRGEGLFEGWMRRIMIHSSIEYYRKHHKMLQVIDTTELASTPLVDASAPANLNAADLMDMVQQLSPGYRMVLNLYAIEGYSHKEIAEIMGISEGASKSQLSRARNILKQLVNRSNGRKYEYAG